MPDVKPEEKVTLVNPSIEVKPEEKNTLESDGSNAEKEGLLKEIKAEREKRKATEARLAELESRMQPPPSRSPEEDDIELAIVAEKLTPYFQKKGFITMQQKEDEDRANKYASEMENLSKKYDGSDGRPAFDPAEVAEYAKKTGNFNLESAYRDLHWKEIVDWEKKRDTSEDYSTEKPNSTKPYSPGQQVPLTTDFLTKRLAEPDGKVWWEQNRDKVLSAMSSGKL